MIRLETRKDRLHLYFKYDPEIIRKIKVIPGRKYHPKDKSWSVSNCAITKAYLNHFFDVRIPYANMRLEPNDVDYKYLRKPYAHQRTITNTLIKYFQHKRSLALFCEPGTGKTQAIIDFLRHCEPNKVLIVCPTPIIGVWQYELLPIEPRVIHGRGRVIDNCKQCSITTYGTLRNDIKKYKDIEFDVVIFDESHCLSQPSSKQSKACKKLRSTMKILSTGTPIRNNIFDAAFQMSAMDSEIFGDKNCILSAFAVFGGFENKEVVGEKNMGMFNLAVKANAISLRKSDCLDLPEKTRKTVNLKMCKEAKELYGRVKEGGLFDEPIDNVLTAITKLRQISSGFVYHNNEVIWFKEDMKKEYIKSISWSVPTIIWTNFKAEVTAIKEAMPKGVKYCVVEGSMDARDKIKMFESGEVDVIIAPLKTISYGVTMNRASRVIFYSPSYSQADTTQAEDRCHRIGQNKSVEYITLTASPIERTIIRCLKEKVNIREFILENNLIKILDK